MHTAPHGVNGIEAPDHLRHDGQGGHWSTGARMNYRAQQLLQASFLSGWIQGLLLYMLQQRCRVRS